MSRARCAATRSPARVRGRQPGADPGARGRAELPASRRGLGRPGSLGMKAQVIGMACLGRPNREGKQILRRGKKYPREPYSGQGTPRPRDCPPPYRPSGNRRPRHCGRTCGSTGRAREGWRARKRRPRLPRTALPSCLSSPQRTAVRWKLQLCRMIGPRVVSRRMAGLAGVGAGVGVVPRPARWRCVRAAAVSACAVPCCMDAVRRREARIRSCIEAIGFLHRGVVVDRGRQPVMRRRPALPAIRGAANWPRGAHP